jgi:hypothetical protein
MALQTTCPRPVAAIAGQGGAAQMGVTLNTARTHLKHVFQKLRVNSQADLVQFILRYLVLAAPDMAAQLLQ